jgi:hypothetical protein
MIVLVLAEVFSFMIPVYASQLRLEEGVTLFYRCARSSSWEATYETWNTSVNVLAFNQTTLVFESNTTTITSTSAVVNIEYTDGIPDYVDYLTALVYLPSECIAKSLQGHLNWTTQVKTLTPAIVTDWTFESLDFTVEAGSFQSVNITLTLAGMDSGALTLIYDVGSGIMIYEQWIPMAGSQIYGDIIILSLTAVTSRPETLQTIINLILASAVFVTPAAMLLHEVRKKFQTRHCGKRLEPGNIRVRDSFPRKPFYAIVIGGLLNLASVMLPWSQLAGSQVYLPLSLPSALAESTAFLASTYTFLTVSLAVYASAIVAWLGIATHAWTRRRIAPQLMTISSSALAFASAIIFTQTGWTASWGVLALAVAGVLALIGTAVGNIKTQKETKKNSQAS